MSASDSPPPVLSPATPPDAKTNRWTFGQWLLEAPVFVQEPGERRQVRLLATLLLILIPFIAVGAVVSWHSIRDPVVRSTLTVNAAALTLAYGLSRTRFYRFGAMLAIVCISTIPFAPGLFTANLSPERLFRSLIWIVMTVLMSNLLLSTRGLAIVFVANGLALALLPWTGVAIELSSFILVVSFVTVVSMLTYVAARHRNLIEQDRLAEVSAANRELDRLRASLEQEVDARTTELARRTLELEENEIFLNSIIDSLPAALFVKDAQTFSYIHWNRAAAELFGVDPGDMLGKSDEFLFPTEQARRFRTEDERIIQDGKSLEIGAEQIQTRKRGPRILHTRKVLIRSADGSPRYILGFSEDITVRKQMEAARTESEALFRALFEHSPDAVILINPHHPKMPWPIVDCNAVACQMNGYSREELIGQSIDILNTTSGTDAERKAYLQSLRETSQFKFETFHRRKDGTIFPVEVSTCLIMVREQELVLGIDRDITERKQAEEALQNQEAQLRMVTRLARIAYWELDLVTLQFTFNDQFYQLIRTSVAEAGGYLIPADRYLRKYVHPEDIPYLQERMQVARNPSGPVTQLEYRVICGDGQIQYALLEYRFIWDSDQRVVKVYGVHMDVTRRKAAEGQLRLELSFQAFLNEITQAALGAVDLDELSQLLADRLGELFDADGCYILKWDLAERGPVPLAAYGSVRETYRAFGSPEPGEATIVEVALEKRQPLTIDYAQNTPSLEPTSHAVLVLPLVAKNEKLGAALISYEKPHSFTTQEIERAKQVADQIALAFEMVKLYEAEREKHQLAMALVEISTLLNASLSVEILLTRILDLIKRVVPYDAGSIFIIEKGKAKILYVRGYEGLGLEVETAVDQLELEVAKTPNLQNMVETCRPMLISDTTADPAWIDLIPTHPFRSWAGVPIHYERRVLAVISIEKLEPNFYQPTHAGRLAAFASQAAIALENARLFEEIRQQAILDALTGVYNRRHILEEARREVERACRYRHPFSLIMLDIDHFKHINDQFGHPVGDQVLQKVSELCSCSLRKADMIGRYGGEEFLILLPETEITTTWEVANRIRLLIEDTYIQVEGEKVSVTVSIGISGFEVPQRCSPDLLGRLINQADQALYKAKQAGRNCTKVFSLS